MTCPQEFTCALFADGELPEADARELTLHLESCAACDRLVTALRGESRMLVQCLQDMDLDALGEAPELTAPASRSIGVATFALGIIGAAVAFKLSTGILFGFELPAELEWLNPKEWALSVGVALNAALYAIRNADDVVRGAGQGIALVSVAALLLFAMTRIFKRGAALGSFLGVLAAIGFVSSPSYAVDMRKGAAASIPASETVDDTLMAAPDQKNQSIDIAGTIKGDLIIVGDVVTISGTVEGNVMAAARRLEITGTVGGTVIGVAQTLIVSGRVARNMIGAGDILTISKTADIGGNLLTGSREAVFDGKTARDMLAAAAMIELRGDVGRHASLAAGQISLSGSSHVGGDLGVRVQKEENLRVAPGAVIGGARNVRLPVAVERRSRYLSASYYIWQIVRVLTLFVTGLLLFKLVPALAPTRIISGPDWLKAGGVGFMTLVAVPVAAIIVAVTVIGFPVALVSLGLYFTGLYFAKIIIAEFVGRSVMKTDGAVSLLAGVFLVVLAVNLPWIGGLINFLLILLGLGAIAMTVYRGTLRRQLAQL